MLEIESKTYRMRRGSGCKAIRRSLTRFLKKQRLGGTADMTIGVKLSALDLLTLLAPDLRSPVVTSHPDTWELSGRRVAVRLETDGKRRLGRGEFYFVSELPCRSQLRLRAGNGRGG